MGWLDLLVLLYNCSQLQPLHRDQHSLYNRICFSLRHILIQYAPKYTVLKWKEMCEFRYCIFWRILYYPPTYVWSKYVVEFTRKHGLNGDSTNNLWSCTEDCIVRVQSDQLIEEDAQTQYYEQLSVSSTQLIPSCCVFRQTVAPAPESSCIKGEYKWRNGC
jgi:hypothetical protein